MSRSTVVPVPGASSWSIEPSSGGGSEHRSAVRITASSRGTGKLTSAGFVAVLSQLASYYTSSVVTTIGRLESGQARVSVDQSTIVFDVMPADAVSQMSSLATVLGTAANITG